MIISFTGTAWRVAECSVLYITPYNNYNRTRRWTCSPSYGSCWCATRNWSQVWWVKYMYYLVSDWRPWSSSFMLCQGWRYLVIPFWALMVYLCTTTSFRTMNKREIFSKKVFSVWQIATVFLKYFATDVEFNVYGLIYTCNMKKSGFFVTLAVVMMKKLVARTLKSSSITECQYLIESLAIWNKIVTLCPWLVVRGDVTGWSFWWDRVNRGLVVIAGMAR